jgi:hypothetical protein
MDAPTALCWLAACAMILASADAFTWEACDADAAPFKPADVLLSPDPPVIGGPVAFTIKTTAGQLACVVDTVGRRAALRARRCTVRAGVAAAAATRFQSKARCACAAAPPQCSGAARGPPTHAGRPPGAPAQLPPPPSHPRPDRAVTAGAISMSVTFAGTPIYEGSDDLCAKTACPIAPGAAEITYRQELPPIAPPVRGGGVEARGGGEDCGPGPPRSERWDRNASGGRRNQVQTAGPKA